MTGTFVNITAIVTGAVMGVTLKKAIPERVGHTIVQGLALSTMVIGLQMALTTKYVLIDVSSLVLGGFTGELLRLEDRLNSIGNWLEKRIGPGQGDFARGFVTTSLVYCVGAMAIVGSIQDGLMGKPATLFVKSLLDGVTAIFFASTMGIGVAFSAIPVFVYQGVITLLAQYVQGILTPPVITEMTATGGVLIFGIGIKILEIKEIKVGNLLPAIGYVMIITMIFQRF